MNTIVKRCSIIAKNVLRYRYTLRYYESFLISGCFFTFRESLENPASLSRYSMERLFWSAYPAHENHLISLSCWWESSDQLILLERLFWSAYPADENHLISLSCWWESSDQLILLMRIIWSAYPADENHLISLSCWWESSDQLILLMRIIWSAYPADENHLISLFCWWELSESADTAFKKPDSSNVSWYSSESADPGWWNYFGDYWFSWSSLMRLGWSLQTRLCWFSWGCILNLFWTRLCRRNVRKISWSCLTSLCWINLLHRMRLFRVSWSVRMRRFIVS